MPSAPAIALAVGGPLAVAGAWLLVRRRRATVWTAMGSTAGALGILAVATGEPSAAGELGVGWELVIGVLDGVVLYVATVVFMGVAGRWPPLARHATALYGQRQGVSLGGALTISVLLTAPGEELLWRGVVQGMLGEAFTPLAAAALTWAAYVAANSVSGSLPIVLGAIVGGAAWSALAWGTGGVAASIGCHAVWTSLMILRPPVPRPNR
jgi:membrane protease YdiL (CAAX protease family)